MGKSEIFIGEFRGAVDRTGSSSVAIDEISTLDHEIFDLSDLVWCLEDKSFNTYYSVEFTSLVALGLSLGGFAFTCAKLTEILCCSRSDICKQFNFHTPKGFT
jgi:hypothetical protein